MDDLIRRNDTLNAIAQYCVGCESCDGIRCRGCQIDDALSIIENCEEVDAEPVRYAKWISEINPNAVTASGRTVLIFRCSCCDFTWANKTMVLNYFRYCPNCGAKMGPIFP